jgi:hypothetical protein
VLLACTATIGTVPLMYCMSRRYLYILDDALTTYTADESGLGEGKPPVPPCILRVGKATQAALEVDDRGKRALVLKVTADFVRVQVRAGGEGLGEGTVGAATCNGVWGAGEGAGWVAVTQTQTGGLVSRADGFPGVPPTPCPSFHSWLQIKAGINSGHANEELLEMLRGVLGALRPLPLLQPACRAMQRAALPHAGSFASPPTPPWATRHLSAPPPPPPQACAWASCR